MNNKFKFIIASIKIGFGLIKEIEYRVKNKMDVM